MGKGRRMKKQAPPELLSNTAIAALKKRKAAQTEVELLDGNTKRRRTSEQKEAQTQRASSTVSSALARKPSAKNTPSESTNRSNGVHASTNVSKRTKRSSTSSAEERLSLDNASIDDEQLREDFDERKLDDSPQLVEDEPSLSNDGDSIADSDFDDEDGGIQQRGKVQMFSDSDDEEVLTAANIEGLSRKLDEDALAQAGVAEAELQTNIEDPSDPTQITPLPPGLAPDLQLLRTRINDTVRLLAKFSSLPQPRPSRSELTTQLQADLATYYGYSPYLCNMLSSLFPVTDLVPFFDANEKQRPVVIRTNTLKTTRRLLAAALINRGAVLQPVGKWSKAGLQIFESPVPLGATPEYLAGQYILQSASSFLPVHALAPQPDERILDMTAAPGGKTTHISALMQNTGAVFANDASKSRTKALIGNIHRLGCTNVIVSNLDSRAFPKTLGGFDRVLLDAPCSGTGVIAKDPGVKTNRTEKDFMLLPHRQKELLLHALDSVDHASKSGGYVVYSTCSITVEENEQVVQYALSKRPNVKLVNTGLEFGVDGFVKFRGKIFDRSMNLTKRYYPHKFNIDGFFVAKFKKTGPLPRGVRPASDQASKAVRLAVEGLTEHDSEKKTMAIDEMTNANDEGTGNGSDSGFSAFDEEADRDQIEKALRNLLKRRGRDPGSHASRTNGLSNGVHENIASKPSDDEHSEHKPHHQSNGAG